MLDKTTNDGVLASIQNTVAVIAPERKIQLGNDVTQSGLESMEVISLFVELEDLFKVSISEEAIDEHDLLKVDKLVAYIRRSTNE